MKEVTVDCVRYAIEDFLDDMEGRWDQEDLFDLDTDIVSEVLEWEFSDIESPDHAEFLSYEEELLTEVEEAVGKLTMDIEENWTDEQVQELAQKAAEVAIAKIKEVFKL